MMKSLNYTKCVTTNTKGVTDMCRTISHVWALWALLCSLFIQFHLFQRFFLHSVAIFTPRQNEGYCHHYVVVVCRLWTFPCEQHNSTKSYPILMKLHRIVPWWVRKNPIDFCYDDVISDVTVTSFPVKSALELVSTIT